MASTEASPPPLDWCYEAVVALKAAVPVDACCSIESAQSDGVVELGSGVCVHADGKILTAAHVAPVIGNFQIIAFADGIAHWARCVDVCEKWDLALLDVMTSNVDPPVIGRRRSSKKQRRAAKARLSLPFVELSSTPPTPKDKLVCVGQPGRPRGERLEVSEGRVASVSDAPLSAQDHIEDDGGLVHTCPAFAGNSGSALLAASGQLVGVHTGYNHRRFTYYGTSLEAIVAFLEPHGIAPPPRGPA